MRPALAVVVCVVVLGGLSLFMHAQQPPPPANDVYQPPPAPGVYTLEIVASFATGQTDPFALDVEEPTQLAVRVNGKEVVRTDELVAGTPVKISPVEGLVVGKNEFHVDAQPPPDQADRMHAVRILVMRDQRQVAEKTVWSRPGSRVGESFELHIDPPKSTASEHEH